MTASLERAASGRATCRLCGGKIAHAEIRVAEEIDDARFEHTVRQFSHLACAVDRDSKLAHDALVSRDTQPDLRETVLADVERRDPRLVQQVHATLAEQGPAVARKAVPLGGDETTCRLLAELANAPGDRDLLLVLGDHLQLRGDDRGELIALELAGELDPVARGRRNELRLALTPGWKPNDRHRWGIGFLRKVELEVRDGVAARASVFAHPSCQLLVGVQLAGYRAVQVTIPPGLLPASLRTLHVIGDLDAPAETMGLLPRLEHLTLEDCARLDRLVHAGLRSLELIRCPLELLRACDPAELPALTRLAIDRSDDDVVAPLSSTGWLARLDELAIRQSSFEPGDAERLERALEGRRLHRLDITGRPIPAACGAALRRICEVVTFPAAPDVGPEPGVDWVEHTGRPDWGRGRVLRKHDDKIEIAFESGTKTFKANAPFLRLCRD